MNRYAKGRRAEWRTRDWLLAEFPGSLVIRSAGSKGPVDLVVFLPRTGMYSLVQVKSGGRRPAPAPFIEGFRIAPTVIWWPPRAKEPVIIENPENPPEGDAA